MKKKDLVQFLEEHRKAGDSVPWHVLSKIAQEKFGIQTRDGKTFSGAGFQNHIQRITGKKHWGNKRPEKKGVFDKIEEPLQPKTEETKMNIEDIIQVSTANLSNDLKKKLLRSLINGG